MLPSNLFILWLGAPNWLAIIIVAWGVVGAATAAVRNHWQFYLVRFLLGIAEGGAPCARRSRACSDVGTSAWLCLAGALVRRFA